MPSKKTPCNLSWTSGAKADIFCVPTSHPQIPRSCGSFICSSRRWKRRSRDIKGDLSIRPIFHQLEHRIETHIFLSFLAYCVHVTFKHQLKMHAPGLPVRQALDEFAAMQLLDVHFPTTRRS
jgi:hypothetical protein